MLYDPSATSLRPRTPLFAILQGKDDPTPRLEPTPEPSEPEPSEPEPSEPTE